MAETKPILLRPTPELAEAMEEAAYQSGVSRQQWMLEHLAGACTDEGFPPTNGVGPDDVPLPGV